MTLEKQLLLKHSEAHPRILPLDVVKVEELLKRRGVDGTLLPEAMAELREMALWRDRALMLDETFVEARAERALERHPRLRLLPIKDLWGMIEAGESADVIAWGQGRHQELELETSDRYNYGWRGDPGLSRELGGGWKRAVDSVNAVKRLNQRWIPKILCMGGNGSSKSEFMPWYAIQQMVKHKDYRVVGLCPSENWAREVMMSRMFWNLPVEWRPEITGKAKSGITGSISYTEKMGFSENKFILPNGSRCTFMFYEDGNPKALEGLELDLVLADEEVGLNWLEAAEYRLVRRAGTLLVGFTPISGYGPTVSYFRGATPKVMETMETELVCLREVEGKRGPEVVEAAFWDKAVEGQVVGQKVIPLMENGADPTKRIVYFPTKWCCYPAGNYETLREEFGTKRASIAKMLERGHGIPTKVRDAAFPLVSLEAHAVPFCERPKVEPKVTWWNVLDPASGRNAFLQWWACYEDGRKILEREWPQQDDYIPGVGQPGPWAVVSTKTRKKDGDRGPAQEPWGLTYAQMAEEIVRVEVELGREVELRGDGTGITVFRRILDSRAGNVESHGTTIAKEFHKVGLRFDDASGKQININANSNSDNVAGITLINNALGYDTKRPLGPLNVPKLMVRYEPPDPDKGVSERGCANTWFSLTSWTGADGGAGACKDPVDCAHYFLRDEPRYVEPRITQARKWGGY